MPKCSMEHALRQAGSSRLVWLAVVALVAVFLVPIAVGGGRAGQEIEHPLAVVILGGLVASTILNLFLLPPLHLRYGHGKPPARTPVLAGLVFVLLTLGPAAATANAQVITPPAGPPPTPRHTGVKALFKDLVDDVKHLPSKENLFWAGVGGGLALGVHPIDDNVNEAWVGNTAVENFFKPGRILGSFPVLMGSAVTTYVAGRAKDQPRVSHMGMDLIQAIVVSEAIVQPIKFITQRERPDKSTSNSFPSGHSADTFAFATALERHLGWKGAVPAYIFSSYVAISRVSANRHWLSDAVFGASVGIIAGRTVTRHGRTFPIRVSAGPGGVMVGYVHTPGPNPARSRPGVSGAR